MKYQILTVSVLAIIATVFVFSHEPKDANALPVSYNVSQIQAPFSTYTRAGFDVLVEGGYNGSITSIYQGRTSNATLNYELGYHPTLPLSLDTSANITAGVTSAATQSISITIGNHASRALVVGVSMTHIGSKDTNKDRVSSITINGATFARVNNKTAICGTNACDSEIWYIQNPPIGAGSIIITPVNSTTYHIVSGAYSLYNVQTVSPEGVFTTATGTSINPTLSLTPTFKGTSWIFDNILSVQTVSPVSATNTIAWIGKTSVMMGASQYNPTPTISSPNALTWTTTNVQWLDVGVEIHPQQNTQNFAYYLGATPESGMNYMTSNGSKVYYVWQTGSTYMYDDIDTTTGQETHDISQATCGGGSQVVFPTQNYIKGICLSTSDIISTSSSNSSLGAGTLVVANNQKVTSTTGANSVFYNTNGTGADGRSVTSNTCEVTLMTSNSSTPMDSIGCDRSIPTHATHYLNGMKLIKIGNYYQNSTLQLLSAIDSDSHKRDFTIPATIYGIPNPDARLIGHFNGADYMLSVSSAQINYAKFSDLDFYLNQNRAYQSYILTLPNTDNHYFLSPSSINPAISIKLYGPSLNTTITKYPMVTIPSGYTMRTTSTAESVIRTLDPRWTNTLGNDYPAISTTSSLFPIILTINNAPTDSSLWLANSAQVINNVNSAWCITQLDTTHTAECDIPVNQCPLVYVADISQSPAIYVYEGTVCATGTNQKTIAYINTVPTSFFTMSSSATTSYTPATNGLLATIRGPSTGYSFSIIIKNQTGAITQNYTSSTTGSIFTHTFNVTNATKPASVYISVGGNQIYQSYLGSPFSLASVSSFFHTYFSYQGFDFLSLIPIIFASMFTRNSVGAGMIVTVVAIATLSWLSVVVIPDLYIAIMAIIAIIGMIGYRSVFG